MSTGKKSRVLILVNFVWERRGVCLDLDFFYIVNRARVA